ncbi:MAG: hypothetical protein O7F69_09050 [Alphaproteobacteria bacterium]|nr:hypothetical protein [Alphaproteobacteria bacterium]
MRNSLDRTVRRLTTVIRRLKDDQAGEISVEVGFPFSAWFFVTFVALMFLDAYFLGGRGFEYYLDVPAEVLANARSLVNV